MQPPKEQVTCDLGQTDQTDQTRQPIEVTVVWCWKKEFVGKDKLDRALEAANKKGLNVPTPKRKMPQDPRGFTSIGMFRDAIRAMFNCRALGLNIMTLTLNYHSGAEEEFLFHDLMIEEWEDIQSTFSDATNSLFRISVILRACKFKTEKIYECGMMSDATEKAMLASPPESLVDEDGNKEPASSHPLDNAVTTILSSSSQKDKTLAPKKFDSPEEQLRWYSGYNVNTIAGCQEWQAKLVLKVQAGFEVVEPEPMVIPDSLNATHEEATVVDEAQQKAHRDSEDYIKHSVRPPYGPKYFMDMLMIFILGRQRLLYPAVCLLWNAESKWPLS